MVPAGQEEPGVDRLEVVRVHQGDGQRGRRAGPPQDLRLGQPVHGPPVRQPRQGVRQGHLLQHRVALLELPVRVLQLSRPVGDALLQLEVQLPQLVQQVLMAALEEEGAGRVADEGDQLFGPPRLE